MIGKAKEKITSSKLFYFTKDLVLHPLFSGSAAMIIGSNAANFFAYIYHLVIGRMLGPSPYSELAVVISLVGVFSAPFSFLGLVIVKFVSAAKEKEVQGIYVWFARKAIYLGLALGIIIFAASPYLSRFLHIDSLLVFIVAPMMTVSLITFVYRSILQGLLRFKEVVIPANVDVITRFLLGVLLIYLGFSVTGAVFALLVGAMLSLALVKYYLRDFSLTGAKVVFRRGREVLSYSAPIFLSSAAIYSFFSTDVILVKHFFDSHSAGIYAALSTLGKVIYFGAAPVSSVMFPMVSKKHKKGESHRRIFFMSLLLTAGIAMGVLLIYWLFPHFAVNVLYGKEFLEAAPLLVWFGLSMALFTLSTLLVNFYLSREKTKVSFAIAAASTAQVVGIWFFHDSLLTVIKVSIFSISLLLATLLIYFGYESKKQQRER